MKNILLPAFIILSFILVSCIEYTEKMKLNSDGSGEITFAIGISEDLLKMGEDSTQLDDFNPDKIKKDFSNKDGVKFVDSKTYNKDGNKWIEIKLEFESVEKLAQASTDSTENLMIGDVSLKLNENGNWQFTRTLTGKNTSSDSSNGDMMAMMFSQYKWRYELELPSNIISTNADSADVDYKNNIVKWTYSLASLTSSPTMTVTFEKEKSSNVIYVVVGAVLLILLSITALNLAKKKKSEPID